MRVRPEISLSGNFWVVAKPEKKLPGTLVIADGGKIRLQLFGRFEDDPTSLLNPVESIERIVGQVEKYGFVTLDQCLYRSWHYSFEGGLGKAELQAERVLLGAAFDKGEAVEVTSAWFSIEGLDEWHSLSGLKIEPSGSGLSIRYQTPDEVELWAEGGVSLNLGFRWAMTPGRTEVSVSQRSFLHLLSGEPQPLSDVLKFANAIVHFFALASGHTVAVRDFSIALPKDEEQRASGAAAERPINLYFESLSFADAPPKILKPEMLFDQEQLSGNNDVFGKWLALHERAAPAMSLYFTDVAGSHQYLNSRFVSVAQAVETYHRRTSQGSKTSLARRLQLLIAPFEAHFGTSHQRNSLIRSVVATRNYFTHFDAQGEDNAAHGRALWELCIRMEALFQLHLLKAIGFDDEMIANLVRKNRGLRDKLPTAAPTITGSADRHRPAKDTNHSA